MCLASSVTDRCPMPRLRCAIPQPEPVRVQSIPTFAKKGLIPSIEPNTAGRTTSTTINAFWPKAKTLLPAVRYIIIDVRSRFSYSSLLSSSSLPTGHFVQALGVNAGTISEVRTTLHEFRTNFNSVYREWQLSSRSRVEIDDSRENTSSRPLDKGFP